MITGDPRTYLARQDVVELAQTQVGAGHFVWGGAGNTPGNDNGAWGSSRINLHENVPDLENVSRPLKPVTPMLLAAWSPVQGKWVCGGRHGKAAWLPKALSNPRLQAKQDLKVSDLTDKDLEELKQRLTEPDNYTWPRSMGQLGGQRVVWGESCVGKRHFDCVGLVNWSVTVALQKTVQYSLEQYKKYGTTKPLREVGLGGLQIGDLLTRTFHIGIVAEEGKVVSALNIPDGVVEQSISIEKWDDWTRPNSSLWRRGA